MTTLTVTLDEWTPDTPGGLVTAQNVLAIANGYAPVKSPQSATPSLTGAFYGGGAFIGSDGNSTLLACNNGGLLKYTGSAWTTIINLTQTQQNRLAQFGDEILLANGASNTLVHYNLVSGANGFIPTAPKAIDVAQARDFVMVITTDNSVQWSQFNQSLTWTTGTNQADKQPSLWGQLRRVIGGEYAILITDTGVVRGTYVGVEGGLDIIWQFDQISQEVGTMAAGSVCHVGRLVFFLSERGFMMCDGNEVTPIADEKFNRWFFSKYSRADISNIWSAVDPRRSLALWAMPGNLGTIIAYNWVLKRATTISLDVSGLFTGYTSGTSLDALDALYGNLDAVPVSLDDPSLQGGNPLLLIADNHNALNALTGDNLEADLAYENVEPSPGRRSRIREVRLVSDTTNASATIDARMRAGDAESVRTAGTMRTNGKLPIRSNGRYNTVGITIPAGTNWTYIQGFELDFEAGDAR